jgi:hypothetical protein
MNNMQMDGGAERADAVGRLRRAARMSTGTRDDGAGGASPERDELPLADLARMVAGRRRHRGG